MSENINETIKLIISLSISGGLFALVLFALKPFMRNRLSKSFQYYIWIVVLLRLMLPFSFGINLMDFAFNTPNAPQMAEQTTIPDDNTINSANISPAITDNTINYIKPNITEQQPSMPITADSAEPLNILKILEDNALWIWLAGVVLSAAFNVFGYFRFIRYIHGAAYVVEMSDCRIKLLKSRFAPTPMLVGVIRPRIYLPDIEYTDRQLDNILLHELTHLRRRDIWLKWFVSLVVSLHWFNPVVYFMRREISRTCELSCDEAVIHNLDSAAKQSYGDTLISVVAESRYPVGLMSTTMCEEKKKLKERLVAIMNYKKKTKIAVLITVVLAVMLTCSAFAFGANIISGKAPKEPPELKITTGNIDLSYVVGLNLWNGKMYDRLNSFNAIMNDTAVSDLPYIKLGKTISIEFSGTAPDSVELSDYILRANGTFKYNLPAGKQPIDITFRNGKGSFLLDTNWSALLSSNSADYAAGATIRGFSLVCKWGNNECEYAFIIRSDATGTNAFNAENLYDISLADLRRLAAKGDELVFEDFNNYEGQEVGSGLYILYFKIEGGYKLLVGGSTATGKPMYANFSIAGIEENIDIRFDDIDEFVGKYHVPDELNGQIYQHLDTIMSSPLEASSTGAYIKAHQAEYDAIVDMGVTALPMLRAILDGGDRGLRGNIASLLIQEIVAAESGKPHSEWMEGVLQSAASDVERWSYSASSNYSFTISKRIANIPLGTIDAVSISTKDCRLLITENTENAFEVGYFGNADEKDYLAVYSIVKNKLTIDVTSTTAYKQDIHNPKGIIIKVPSIVYNKLEVSVDSVDFAMDLEHISGNITVKLKDAKADFFSESAIDCNLNINSNGSYILLTSKSYTAGILSIENKDGNADLSIHELLADVNITNEFGRIELILQTIPQNIDFNINNSGKMVLPVGWSSSHKLGVGKPAVQIVNKDKFTLTIDGIRPND